MTPLKRTWGLTIGSHTSHAFHTLEKPTQFSEWVSMKHTWVLTTNHRLGYAACAWQEERILHVTSFNHAANKKKYHSILEASCVKYDENVEALKNDPVSICCLTAICRNSTSVYIWNNFLHLKTISRSQDNNGSFPRHRVPSSNDVQKWSILPSVNSSASWSYQERVFFSFFHLTALWKFNPFHTSMWHLSLF